MAIKTFSSGEILTASDTNAYLTNSGLVYVTSGSLATATTNVVGCFTSSYRNYRIVLDNISASAAGDLYFNYLSGTTTPNTGSYYWVLPGLDSAANVQAANANPGSTGYTGWQTNGAGGAGGVSMDIYDPNISAVTMMTTIAGSKYSAGVYRVRQGMVAWDNTTIFTGIQFVSTTATTFSGNYTVYGYRSV